MKDIEDRLKEEYDKVEVPSYMFDTSRVFKRVEEEKKQRSKKIISIAASVMVILIFVVVLFFIIPKSNNEEYDIKEKTNINEVKGEITINNNNSRYDVAEENIVLVGKVKSIIDYQIIDNIPYTKVTIEVLNCLHGKVTGLIELYTPGGIFSADEIKSSIKNIDDLNKYDDKDLIKVTCYNEVYIPIAKLNDTYIITIVKKSNNYFVDMDKAYGFKEYDPETNIVKDDMGDVELEIDKYLENINI